MSEYTDQAEKFLTDTGTTFEIVYQYTGPYFTGDKEKRDVYRFTLKNAKGEYSSTFGNSQNATEARALFKIYGARAPITGGWSSSKDLKEAAKYKAILRNKSYLPPSAYDVLACLEKYEPDTFDNWCAECGYNDKPLSEYPNVLKVWTSCVEQYRGIARLFTAEQMEQLREIA